MLSIHSSQYQNAFNIFQQSREHNLSINVNFPFAPLQPLSSYDCKAALHSGKPDTDSPRQLPYPTTDETAIHTSGKSGSCLPVGSRPRSPCSDSTLTSILHPFSTPEATMVSQDRITMTERKCHHQPRPSNY